MRSIGRKTRTWALVTLVVAGALAGAQAVEAAQDVSRARFDVALSAQVTKTWDYVTTRQEGECTVTTRVRGSRIVTLRSARPTIVTATSGGGPVSFSPAVVRFVTARASQRGSVTTTERGPGCAKRTDVMCARPRRALANRSLTFFLSRRDEISFRRTPDFATGFSTTCPPEAPDVRVERPGVHQAQGELSERDLFNRGIRFQTATGGSVETTVLEGDPDGKVLGRVTWALTFRRR